MPGALLDTNAYAAFKRGLPEAVEIARNTDLLFLPVVALGELLAGFAVGSQEERNRHELNVFLASPRVKVLVADGQTASFYAQVYMGLRAKGRPIPSNDLWIAAIALQHELTLFSYDAHFAEVDGLKVIPQRS